MCVYIYIYIYTDDFENTAAAATAIGAFVTTALIF
jgi:hypothetical protein